MDDDVVGKLGLQALRMSSCSFSNGDRSTSPTAWVFSLDTLEVLDKDYGMLRETSMSAPQQDLRRNGMG